MPAQETSSNNGDVLYFVSCIGLLFAVLVAIFSIFFILVYYSATTVPLSQNLEGVFTAMAHVSSVLVLGIAFRRMGHLRRWTVVLAFLTAPYFLWVPFDGFVLRSDYGDWMIYVPFLVVAFCLLLLGIATFFRKKETT